MANGGIPLDYPGAIAPSGFRVRLSPDACSGCGACVSRCPFHALEISEDPVPRLREERCYGCGDCVVVCSAGALFLEEIRPREHIRIK